MKRNESKIPLVLTIAVLGYFIFWAIGYVSHNRPSPAQPQTVTSLQMPANISETKPEPARIESPVAPIPEQQVIQKTPAKAQGQMGGSEGSNKEDVVVADHGVRNRKIMGVLDDVTKKH